MDVINKLNIIEQNKNWNDIKEIISTREFPKNEKGKKDRKVLAKLGDILLKEKNLPVDIKVLILKCFTFSCSRETQYQHKSIKISNDNLYAEISSSGFSPSYPESSFPFEPITKYVIDYLATWTTSYPIPDDEVPVIKECLSFLCNLFAYDEQDLIDESYRRKLINVGNLLSFDCAKYPIIMSRVCCLIHNILNIWYNNFTDEDIATFTQGLLKADECGVKSARDAIIILLNKYNSFHAYETLTIDLKLYLLEFIYKYVKSDLDLVSDPSEDPGSSKVQLPKNWISFLINRFKERSNLILKTEDTYVKEQMQEPSEVIILLDILCALSSAEQAEEIRSDTSLLINSVYLLRAVHMAGKDKNNFFTPVQKLSQVAPAGKNSREESIEDHVAFGFKSSLIRLIANMVYKKRKNQDLVRELDGISILLDCCNIDARNPLITQWCILAIRNLCDNNSKNKEFISSSTKIRFIDNQVIREMGITLTEDGNPIGIVPLPD
ncbi:uncharacterized protein LOC103580559 [Microplitis demolitor]|uniref:uncharacterized protein LOC103580559 n=1 Tax=Microplitis demolitor TaxID=69319 RepID=UPI00235B5B2A|nr:uncharacterized protein LOC103580559 [Microplitis demolitor]